MAEITKEEIQGALRYDTNKVRHDLVSANSINELAKVLTFGAIKYAPNNWQKGMKWSRVLGSLKRHLNAIERGEDVDPETGLLHSAHVLCNAMFLTDYYKIYPQGDDRQHKYLSKKRIGLDIDDVLADWCPTFCKLADIPIPNSWNFGFPDILDKLKKKGIDYNKVMENLPVKIKPEDIPFEPVCYITNRIHVDVSIAENWLNKNGFPKTKVIQTTDKASVAKEMQLDIFVDDKYETFVEMNKQGICTYLFDAPHNQRYDVGYKRIYNLKELDN